MQEFIIKLNEATGKNYRLPTEAEWEYAARGGNQSQGYKYSGSNDIFEVAWWYANSGKKTHPVGTKKPNELDIYDMCGNVSEWCGDGYANYTDEPRTNPYVPAGVYNCIHRGGGWSTFLAHCRVSYRQYTMPTSRLNYIGFRLVHP
ncbi:MAG: formylglycine-generating enzyme family protein [Bacteroidetes bacterium]|nr:formylglycine-generating enzyme family protein [Bacteroidota bacterium]MCL2303677.1 formylglycine-generating enzyme family protein [Lentimicrobiaceae bacterium]